MCIYYQQAVPRQTLDKHWCLGVRGMCPPLPPTMREQAAAKFQNNLAANTPVEVFRQGLRKKTNERKLSGSGARGRRDRMLRSDGRKCFI